MLPRSLALGAAVAALLTLFAAPAHAEPTQLFPGVTYDREVQFTPFGPVAISVIRAPRPVGAYRLRTVLAHERVLREERLSSMQRRLAGEATMVGINGDFSRIADGRPTGITLRDGVLATPPNASRSSLGVGLDGTLDIRRVSFRATWRGLGERRPVDVLNDVPARNGVSLFTSDWGATTPAVRGSYAVVLADVPPAVPGIDLVSTVAAAYENAGVGIAPGSAVLVARGDAADRLREEAPIGASVTVRLTLEPDWSTVSDAVGGGPVLVRDGRPVFRANEAFTASQLAPRHPRSAVGQLADGRLVFVVVDGRQPGYSIGMTTFQMALTMVRLGAVRAMQLDGGGSSTLAFDGTVLNSPSDGRERPVPTALMLEYVGAFVAPPAEEIVSPNGDGVAEAQRLAYKVVRPSTVTVTLRAPGGATAFQETVAREPGTYGVAFPPAASPEGQPAPEPLPPAEGRWTLKVSAVDDQGLASSALRRFTVNSTLGFLRVEPRRLLVPRAGARAAVRWHQARPAQVTVTVETTDGVLVRRIVRRRFEPGEQAVAWDGRLRSGKLPAGGRYLVRVVATNGLGEVVLDSPLVVRRVVRPRR